VVSDDLGRHLKVITAVRNVSESNIMEMQHVIALG